MSDGAPVKAWLIEPLDPAVAAVIERLRQAEDVCQVALMPDVHLAADVCVGTVLATHRLLYPGAVGGDIGCGMLALAFDAGRDLLADPASAGKLLNGLCSTIPASRHHRSRTLPYPSDLAALALSHPSLEAFNRSEGRLQLGTLGGGNHFVEFQADEEDRLWLMIHSGSRALGQAIRDYHLAWATPVVGGLRVLDADTEAGQAYLHDLAWARRYADANRRALAEAAAQLLAGLFGVRPLPETLITSDHNHVAWEEHFGQTLLVHRKGAMPASAGTLGVLPGSMGTLSYHVEGRGHPDSLNSSAHGAGRAFSREGARRRISARELCRQMSGIWFDYRLAETLREEAPAAYKDVRAVLRAQHELVRVTRTLRPLLTYKSP